MAFQSNNPNKNFWLLSDEAIFPKCLAFFSKECDRIHIGGINSSDSDSLTESERSSLDEVYFKHRPPPLPVKKTIIIESKESESYSQNNYSEEQTTDYSSKASNNQQQNTMDVSKGTTFKQIQLANEELMHELQSAIADSQRKYQMRARYPLLESTDPHQKSTILGHRSAPRKQKVAPYPKNFGRSKISSHSKSKKVPPITKNSVRSIISSNGNLPQKRSQEQVSHEKVVEVPQPPQMSQEPQMPHILQMLQLSPALQSLESPQTSLSSQMLQASSVSQLPQTLPTIKKKKKKKKTRKAVLKFKKEPDVSFDVYLLSSTIQSNNSEKEKDIRNLPLEPESGTLLNCDQMDQSKQKYLGPTSSDPSAIESAGFWQEPTILELINTHLDISCIPHLKEFVSNTLKAQLRKTNTLLVEKQCLKPSNADENNWQQSPKFPELIPSLPIVSQEFKGVQKRSFKTDDIYKNEDRKESPPALLEVTSSENITFPLKVVSLEQQSIKSGTQNEHEEKLSHVHNRQDDKDYSLPKQEQESSLNKFDILSFTGNIFTSLRKKESINDSKAPALKLKDEIFATSGDFNGVTIDEKSSALDIIADELFPLQFIDGSSSPFKFFNERSSPLESVDDKSLPLKPFDETLLLPSYGNNSPSLESVNYNSSLLGSFNDGSSPSQLETFDDLFPLQSFKEHSLSLESLNRDSSPLQYFESHPFSLESFNKEPSLSEPLNNGFSLLKSFDEEIFQSQLLNNNFSPFKLLDNSWPLEYFNDKTSPLQSLDDDLSESLLELFHNDQSPLQVLDESSPFQSLDDDFTLLESFDEGSSEFQSLDEDLSTLEMFDDQPSLLKHLDDGFTPLELSDSNSPLLQSFDDSPSPVTSFYAGSELAHDDSSPLKCFKLHLLTLKSLNNGSSPLQYLDNHPSLLKTFNNESSTLQSLYDDFLLLKSFSLFRPKESSQFQSLHEDLEPLEFLDDVSSPLQTLVDNPLPLETLNGESSPFQSLDDYSSPPPLEFFHDDSSSLLESFDDWSSLSSSDRPSLPLESSSINNDPSPLQSLHGDFSESQSLQLLSLNEEPSSLLDDSPPLQYLDDSSSSLKYVNRESSLFEPFNCKVSPLGVFHEDSSPSFGKDPSPSKFLSNNPSPLELLNVYPSSLAPLANSSSLKSFKRSLPLESLISDSSSLKYLDDHLSPLEPLNDGSAALYGSSSLKSFIGETFLLQSLDVDSSPLELLHKDSSALQGLNDLSPLNYLEHSLKHNDDSIPLELLDEDCSSLDSSKADDKTHTIQVAPIENDKAKAWNQPVKQPRSSLIKFGRYQVNYSLETSTPKQRNNGYLELQPQISNISEERRQNNFESGKIEMMESLHSKALVLGQKLLSSEARLKLLELRTSHNIEKLTRSTIQTLTSQIELNTSALDKDARVNRLKNERQSTVAQNEEHSYLAKLLEPAIYTLASFAFQSDTVNASDKILKPNSPYIEKESSFAKNLGPKERSSTTKHEKNSNLVKVKKPSSKVSVPFNSVGENLRLNLPKITSKPLFVKKVHNFKFRNLTAQKVQTLSSSEVQDDTLVPSSNALGNDLMPSHFDVENKSRLVPKAENFNLETLTEPTTQMSATADFQNDIFNALSEDLNPETEVTSTVSNSNIRKLMEPEIQILASYESKDDFLTLFNLLDGNLGPNYYEKAIKPKSEKAQENFNLGKLPKQTIQMSAPFELFGDTSISSGVIGENLRANTPKNEEKPRNEKTEENTNFVKLTNPLIQSLTPSELPNNLLTPADIVDKNASPIHKKCGENDLEVLEKSTVQTPSVIGAYGDHRGLFSALSENAELDRPKNQTNFKHGRVTQTKIEIPAVFRSRSNYEENPHFGTLTKSRGVQNVTSFEIHSHTSSFNVLDKNVKLNIPTSEMKPIIGNIKETSNLAKPANAIVEPLKSFEFQDNTLTPANTLDENLSSNCLTREENHFDDLENSTIRSPGVTEASRDLQTPSSSLGDNAELNHFKNRTNYEHGRVRKTKIEIPAIFKSRPYDEENPHLEALTKSRRIQKVASSDIHGDTSSSFRVIDKNVSQNNPRSERTEQKYNFGKLTIPVIQQLTSSELQDNTIIGTNNLDKNSNSNRPTRKENDLDDLENLGRKIQSRSKNQIKPNFRGFPNPSTIRNGCDETQPNEGGIFIISSQRPTQAVNSLFQAIPMVRGESRDCFQSLNLEESTFLDEFNVNVNPDEEAAISPPRLDFTGRSASFDSNQSDRSYEFLVDNSENSLWMRCWKCFKC